MIEPYLHQIRESIMLIARAAKMNITAAAAKAAARVVLRERDMLERRQLQAQAAWRF